MSGFKWWLLFFMNYSLEKSAVLMVQEYVYQFVLNQWFFYFKTTTCYTYWLGQEQVFKIVQENKPLKNERFQNLRVLNFRHNMSCK